MGKNLDYGYYSSHASWDDTYILDPVIRILKARETDSNRIFEVGCGNGITAARLYELGYDITGIDSSASGILHVNETHPQLKLYEGSVYDELAEKYGTFPIVLSLEVVEHCTYPRRFAKSIFNLLEKDGIALVSTPYHGYLKNLVLAISGKFDAHFTAL